jgi:hypothetical protein
MLSLIAFSFIGGGLVIAVFLLVRNFYLLNYILYLINRAGYAARQDIQANPWDNSWTKRFDAVNEVPYGKMLFSWRRFDSFYPDKWFINPNEHR